jgi:hypothetical protein
VNYDADLALIPTQADRAPTAGASSSNTFSNTNTFGGTSHRFCVDELDCGNH